MSDKREVMNYRRVPARPYNMEKVPKKKRSVGGILFGVAAAVLSVTFLIMLFSGIGILRESSTWYDYHADEEDLIRDYTYGNYAKLFEDAYSDAGADREYTETELALHAAAEYYEAATMARAFEAAGDQARAAACRQRMAELPGKMGEFADCAEKIDEVVFGE